MQLGDLEFKYSVYERFCSNGCLSRKHLREYGIRFGGSVFGISVRLGTSNNLCIDVCFQIGHDVDDVGKCSIYLTTILINTADGRITIMSKTGRENGFSLHVSSFVLNAPFLCMDGNTEHSAMKR